MKNEFHTVVDILTSKSHSLKELAAMSNRNIFRFYNSADLSSLDLSGQDLSGLNFDNADIRLSNVSQIVFDMGAFNNSIIDDSQLKLKDEFEFDCTDVINFPEHELLVFARVRRSIVDEAIATLGFSFVQAASGAGISVTSLRKSRNWQVISIDTAKSVFRFLLASFDRTKTQAEERIRLKLLQPNVQLLTGGNSGDFEILTRSRLNLLFEIRKFRILYQANRNPGAPVEYRDTAEYLSYYEELMNKNLGLPDNSKEPIL